MTRLNTVLTIAGTDPTGGAGIMADLKSFQARGVYGMAVVTSVVAQNTRGVQAVRHLDLEILEEQLKSVFSDISPDAVKTGMLAQVDTVELVASYLKQQTSPYVLDPVMVATSGHRLIEEETIAQLKQQLLPLATIITPNLPEAEVLLGEKLEDEAAIVKAGYSLQKEYGVKNIIIKGGHLTGKAKDYLFLENDGLTTLSSERFDTRHTHGTGCTFAAVITAELAKGRGIQEAVATAKRFITEAIRTAPELGHGHGPVNHTTYQGE